MRITVDASGLVELEAALTAEIRDLPKRVRAVVRKTAHDIEADAKQLAPVDTGALRSSISTSTTSEGAYSYAAEVGPTVDYGDFVEHGTATTGPQPYLRPAFDRRFPEFEAGLAAAAITHL